MYPVDEVIKGLPDDKAFGCATKYHVHSKLMDDLQWSLNLKALPIFETTKQDPNVQQLIMIRLCIICLVHLLIHKHHVQEKINYGINLSTTQTLPINIASIMKANNLK